MKEQWPSQHGCLKSLYSPVSWQSKGVRPGAGGELGLPSPKLFCNREEILYYSQLLEGVPQCYLDVRCCFCMFWTHFSHTKQTKTQSKIKIIDYIAQ